MFKLSPPQRLALGLALMLCPLMFVPNCITPVGITSASGSGNGSGGDDDTDTPITASDDPTKSTPTPVETPTPPTPPPNPTPPLTTGWASRLATCATTVTGTSYSGTLTCPTEVNEIQWDFFQVNVAAGDCLFVSADNAGTGAADLLAFVVDPNDIDIFGLAQDYSQLEDELDCSVTPWDSFACPERAVTMNTSGFAWVAVAQWGGDPAGATCASGMSDYQITIGKNGNLINFAGGPTINDTALQ